MTSSKPKPEPIVIGERREHLNLRALTDLLVTAAEHGPSNEKDEGPQTHRPAEIG